MLPGPRLARTWHRRGIVTQAPLPAGPQTSATGPLPPSARPARWGLLALGLSAVAAGFGIGALTRHPMPTVVGPQTARPAAPPRERARTLTPPAFPAPKLTAGTEREFLVFVPHTSALTAPSQKAVDRLAETLKQSPKARVQLTGYADEAGQSATERRLAESRVLAVKTMFEERGIEGQRIQTAVSDAPAEDGAGPETAQGAVGADLVSPP